MRDWIPRHRGEFYLEYLMVNCFSESIVLILEGVSP
jgi:hypothetical protein